MTDYNGWQRSIKKRSIYESAKRVESEGRPVTAMSIRDDMNQFKTNRYNLNAKQITGIAKTIPVMQISGEIKNGKRTTATFSFKKDWE
jgi:uncharacterized alpha/beta hydrolase family protein